MRPARLRAAGGAPAALRAHGRASRGGPGGLLPGDRTGERSPGADAGARIACGSSCTARGGRRGMRVLVTGGTGFTGKALVRRLLDLGHEVVALDYKEGLKTAELREWGAEVVLGSVTDEEVVRRAM